MQKLYSNEEIIKLAKKYSFIQENTSLTHEAASGISFLAESTLKRIKKRLKCPTLKTAQKLAVFLELDEVEELYQDAIKTSNEPSLTEISILNVNDTDNHSNQPQATRKEELISIVDSAIAMHICGDEIGYRKLIQNERLVTELKRNALFDTLRDLAEIDLSSSLKTGHAQTLLNYIQSCYVLFDLEPAIIKCHEKLDKDPALNTFYFREKITFLRSYAQLLMAAERPDLAILLLERMLSSSLTHQLKHNQLSHVSSTLGECYNAIKDYKKAYDIAKHTYDEHKLTTNAFSIAISGTHLGIAFLHRNEIRKAHALFRSSFITFKDLVKDKRATAWSGLYFHVSVLRLKNSEESSLDIAMRFYLEWDHISREILELMKESKLAKVDWKSSYDPVINRIYNKVTNTKLKTETITAVEDHCTKLLSSSVFNGTNALNHSVSQGGFRLNSILTNSFIQNLNKDAELKYLEKILSKENFYRNPFYNKIIRELNKKRPDLIEEIIFPIKNKISKTNDSIRAFYARILEYHKFFKEADFLLESMDNKKRFRYLNNKGNILSHQQSTFKKAINYYRLAVKATNNKQKKSIAIHNQALAIFKSRIKSRYDEAEKLCLLSVKHRQNRIFSAPLQTLLRIQINKERHSKTQEVLANFEKKYYLTSKQMRYTISEIKNKDKLDEARKYLARKNKNT